MNSSKYRTINGISAIVLFVLLFLGAFGYSFFDDSLYFPVLKMIRSYYSYHGATFGEFGYYIAFVGAPIFVLIANMSTNCVASRTVSIISAIINAIAWITVSNKVSYFYMDKSFGFYLAVLLCVLIVIMSICAAIEEEPSTYRHYDTDDKPVSTDSNRKEEPVIREEKKEFLFRDMFYEDGPIIIRKAELIITDSAVKLRISIKNISDKTISIIRLYVKTTNALGEVVDEAFEHMFIDINIAPGNCLRNGEITLSSAFIRKAEVNIDTIMFDDGTKWERNSLELVESENSSFVFSEHESIIAGFKYAKEIQDYINELVYPDDEILNNKIKPMIDEYVYVEKNYGNKKNDVIKKIKEIYGLPVDQVSEANNLIEEDISTENNDTIANNIEEHFATAGITNNVSGIKENGNSGIETVDEISVIEENVSAKTEARSCDISQNLATESGEKNDTIFEKTKKSKIILLCCCIILGIVFLTSGITILVMKNINQSSEEYDDADEDIESNKDNVKKRDLPEEGKDKVDIIDEVDNEEIEVKTESSFDSDVKAVLKEMAGCWVYSNVQGNYADNFFLVISETGEYESGIFESGFDEKGWINEVSPEGAGYRMNVTVPSYYDESMTYIPESTYNIIINSVDNFENVINVDFLSGITYDYVRMGTTLEEITNKYFYDNFIPEQINSDYHRILDGLTNNNDNDLETNMNLSVPKCDFGIPKEFVRNDTNISDDSVIESYNNLDGETINIIQAEVGKEYKNLKDFPQKSNAEIITDNDTYYITTFEAKKRIGYKAIRNVDGWFIGFEVTYNKSNLKYYDEVISNLFNDLKKAEIITEADQISSSIDIKDYYSVLPIGFGGDLETRLAKDLHTDYSINEFDEYSLCNSNLLIYTSMNNDGYFVEICDAIESFTIYGLYVSMPLDEALAILDNNGYHDLGDYYSKGKETIYLQYINNRVTHIKYARTI